MAIHDHSLIPSLLLANSENQQALLEWSVPQTASSFTFIHQLFEEQVVHAPEAIAVTYEEQHLSYQALNYCADTLAYNLQQSGVGPGVLVGICIERSLAMVIGILAVLKAGAGYVPLDPAYPRERQIFILQDAQVKVLLTQQHLIEIFLDQNVSVICIDTPQEASEQESIVNLNNEVTKRDIAYVIYTSGSTGLPKGVVIEHYGLSNMIEEQIRLFGIQSQHRIAQFASFSFDASVSELFMALIVGAQLCLVPQEWRWPASVLWQYLQTYAITTITLPPSVLAALPSAELPALQTIISAGEELSSEVVARWLAGRRVFNAYGPTEATVCATIGQCCAQTNRPSIGYPIANTRLYLLDTLFQPVPIGVTGEVYIGGLGLARGYLNRPELVAEKFLPDPFSSLPGARLYKTGDLARYLPDGSIECIGRIDRMVKVRGFRVELGEVEAIVEQHPLLLHCLVMVYKDHNGMNRLVAYVIPHPEYACSEMHAMLQEMLVRFLQEKLPKYMLPAAFVVLSAFPLTPNGKIDRHALPIPDFLHRS